MPGAVRSELFASVVGPGFRPWLESMQRLGGCAGPVYLVGHTVTRDAGSGDVLHVFTSASQPYGRLAVACRNRRESRCAPCSWLHQGDTFHLVVSGLAGGKGVPESVARHPRLFVTLTAPSFGAVHRAAGQGEVRERCRVRRGAGVCVHGAAVSCNVRHRADDVVVGSALCGECYEYGLAVLWNANAGLLWNRFVVGVRRAVASGAGISRSRLGGHVRVSFAKVAEFQRRGSVHLHAVLRFDGPDGPGSLPPAWATAEVLASAVRAAGGAVVVGVASPAGSGVVALRLGAQLDVREITGGDDGLSDAQVGRYVAKYVTKGDIPGLVLGARLRSEGQIDASPLSDHARALMREAWRLGGLKAFEPLRLRAWAHQLGFRGNIATKSRAYSTTYGALRAERARFRREAAGRVDFDPETTRTVSRWRFDHQGHSPVESMFAAGIADDIAQRRETAREAGWSGAARPGWVGGDA